jgi:hypothetical protein
MKRFREFKQARLVVHREQSWGFSARGIFNQVASSPIGAIAQAKGGEGKSGAEADGTRSAPQAIAPLTDPHCVPGNAVVEQFSGMTLTYWSDANNGIHTTTSESGITNSVLLTYHGTEITTSW